MILMQISRLMKAIDMDGDGLIDIDEFVSAMATVKEVKIAGDLFRWRQLFDRFDVDESGDLGLEELEAMAGKIWGEGHVLQIAIEMRPFFEFFY